MIIARTDARQSEGLDGAIRRMAAYEEAGADILFIEGPAIARGNANGVPFPFKPMLANMADGGKTPILSAAELADMGYAGAIFPASTALAANAAVAEVLTSLKNHGTSRSPKVALYDFNKFCLQIGFDAVWAFERKWGEGSEESE